MDSEKLEKIKKEILSSTALSDQEKQEWVYLLPKMTEQQAADLEKLILIKIPKPTPRPQVKLQPAKPTISPTPQPAAVQKVEPPPAAKPAEKPKPPAPIPSPLPASPIKPIQSAKKPSEPKVSPPRPKPSPPSLKKPDPRQKHTSFSKIESVSVRDLKNASTVHAFLQDLKNQMKKQLASGQTRWSRVIAEYHKSPLYHSYLKSGVMLMSGQGTAELSHDDFEALTDFHRELKKLK